jgi:A/G-specific adenine glycosylase
VKPYFEAFTSRWPSVADLAAAADSDVMAAWAGLGYYARARNLLACARAIVRDHGGRFPADEATLLTLPGIGAYSAAAISSIAYGEHAVVVDGNVERVLARVQAVKVPLPAAKAELKRLAALSTPELRAGDYAQAMMDLGATICTPKSPSCLICPVELLCAGKAQATDFPVKLPKKSKPHRTGITWWIQRGQQVLLVRRHERHMLGGMRALPSDGWDNKGADIGINGGEYLGEIEHVFTHFSLMLEIRTLPAETSCIEGLDGEWWPVDRMADAGLPSLFAKAADLALKGRNDR